MKGRTFSGIGVLILALIIGGVIATPVAAPDEPKLLPVPYYEQETPYYCGPAVSQMWIDFHDGCISQNTLYSYIQSHNQEGWPTWYTDPYGLACCVANYVDNLVVDNHRWNFFNTANVAIATDLVDRDIPSAVLINSGEHWVLVKGVSYNDYYGSVSEVYGFWVHDPWQGDANHYYSADDWSDVYTQVQTFSGSNWDNYWVTVQGYWGSRGDPDYETAARNITLMPDEEDNILLTEDTDIAAFARDEMNRIKIFQEELAGTVPGDAVFVHSLDEKRYDYWLIPYEKDGYIALIAQVSIKGDVADFSSAYAPLVKTQDVVQPTMDEARKVLSENGYDGSLSARLVWKPCEQTQSLVHPVWEFELADGDLIYVGYNPFDGAIQIYDELTEKTILG
jgi:hypothetical protein